MEPFNIEISCEPTAVCVTVSGEIDLSSAPQLLDALLVAHQSHRQDVVLDLAAVTFMDSQGLGSLVAAHDRLKSQDAAIRVVNIPPFVAKLLRITGVDAHLGIKQSEPAT